MTYALFVVMTLVIAYQGAYIYLSQKEHNRHVEARESEWRDERQQLLDRIQANSFAEYKTAEVRVTKAKKDEQPIVYPEML